MSDLVSFLSTKTGPLGARVEDLVRSHTLLWHGAPAESELPKKRYARADKRAVERELSDIVTGLSSEQTRTAFLDGTLDAARLEDIAAGLRPAFKRLLRLVDLPLEAVYDARFIDSTRRFIQTARDFDPGLGLASAYQALRNVWIMNSLQFDLGLPVEHDDAIFAYSMVYPYLDNVLDDAREAESGKLAFVTRLRSWLEGSGEAAASPREEKLLSLVRLIERRFARAEFPGLYRSLLTIYNAQVKSLLQQRPAAAPTLEDILSISLEKGGTSVLADGYLVAGALEPADEEFYFGFGTVLQLADDLQDIAEDSRCGHRTLFSDQAARPLSHDGGPPRVLSRRGPGEGPPEGHAGPGRPVRRDRARNRADVPRVGGETPGYFRRGFVRTAKSAFPVRSSYLRKLRRRLKDKMPAGCDRLADLDPGLVALMALSSRAFALD